MSILSFSNLSYSYDKKKNIFSLDYSRRSRESG